MVSPGTVPAAAPGIVQDFQQAHWLCCIPEAVVVTWAQTMTHAGCCRPTGSFAHEDRNDVCFSQEKLQTFCEITLGLFWDLQLLNNGMETFIYENSGLIARFVSDWLI